MKNYFFIIALSLSALLLSCHKPTEQTVVSEEKTEVAQPSNALQTLRMAYDLARYGYETESAMALIEAADIIASIPVTTEDGKAGKVALAPQKLLSDARELAGDNECLLALIADSEKRVASMTKTVRGAVDGPIEKEIRDDEYNSGIFNIAFRAGELAEVAVIGDGDTDLDLYVYDANGNLIVSDTSYSGNCYVSWIPFQTSNFTIKVINRGNLYTTYTLLTN